MFKAVILFQIVRIKSLSSGIFLIFPERIQSQTGMKAVLLKVPDKVRF